VSDAQEIDLSGPLVCSEPPTKGARAVIGRDVGHLCSLDVSPRPLVSAGLDLQENACSAIEMSMMQTASTAKFYVGTKLKCASRFLMTHHLIENGFGMLSSFWDCWCICNRMKA